MANEENRRKKVVTEGNGSVNVNKDEKVSGGPASQGGSKKPASSGPSTAQKPVSLADYVSGMTDDYAMYQYSKIFVPAAWSVR